MKITLLVVLLALEPVFIYFGLFAPKHVFRFSIQASAFGIDVTAIHNHGLMPRLF